MTGALFFVALMLCMFAPHLWPIWVFGWMAYAMLAS